MPDEDRQPSQDEDLPRPKLRLGEIRPVYRPGPATGPVDANGPSHEVEDSRPPRAKPSAYLPGRFQRMAPWLLFLVLGAATGLLRYGAYYPPATDLLRIYGPYAAGALHVVITVLAFQDTIFSGMLCLVIPGYSLYYLFAVTDRHLLRAAAAGLLVGIAEDSLVFYQDLALSIHHTVASWIAGH